MSEKEERLAAIEEVRTWIGVKWMHQGRHKSYGVDCIGLAIVLAAAAHSLTPEINEAIPSNYSRLPHKDELRRLMDKFLVKVEREKVLAGDILLAAWRVHPTHLLIVSNSTSDQITAPFNIIHADNVPTIKCIAEQPLIWANWRISGCYRFPRWA